jgi:BirA family transcriptional regulator, biotin operon repressor / biotin---[acetyl-CoA-carboxylase] ligase
MQIEYHHFATLASTNDYAKGIPSLFEKGKLHVVVAEEQSGGRGRYERKWHSEKGGLYVSFCFISEERDPLELINQLVQTVTEVLAEEGVVVTLKMPNDLMLDQQKIAGLLLEPISYGAVLGLGLNVNQTAEQLRNVGQGAISLFVATGKSYDIKALLERISKRFLRALCDGNS